MTENATPSTAEIVWEGDSWDVLKQWPKEIRIDFGHALRLMQQGNPADLQVRPMPSVGRGVFELKDADQTAWYRMLYLARVGNRIYVLDCFTKDTAKTEKKDLNRARTRLSRVLQRLQEEKKNAKR